MKTNEFFTATAGRLLLATTALAAIGGGVVAFVGPAPLLLTTLLPMFCVVAMIMSVGMSLERFPYISVAMLLALPFVCGFYFAGMYTLSAGAHAGPGLVLIGAGVFPAILAMRGERGDAKSEDTSAASSRSPHPAT